MARKSGHISILQFGEGLIALLRVRRSAKGLDIVAFETVRGDWSASEGALAEALRELVKRLRLADDDVYSVLPRHLMTTRILELPSTDPDEIRGIVALGVEEYVPYPPDEVVIDQCILQRMPDGHARVLAVFAHDDVINSHVAVLREAGVEPKSILVSTACIASALLGGGRDESTRYAFADLSAGGLEVLILGERGFEFGRGVAAAQDWTTLEQEGSEAFEELLIELRASLSAYRRESVDGMGAERIELASPYADVAGVGDMLAGETGLECGAARVPAGLVAKGLDELQGRFPAALLGAALTAQDRARVAINLLPRSVVHARATAQSRRTAYLAGGLAAGVLLCAIGLYAVNVYQRTSYIRDLESRVEQVRTVAEVVRAKQYNLRQLQTRVDRTGTALELLAKICELAPGSGLNISKFSYTRNKEIVVEGHVLDMTDGDRFAQILREEGGRDIPLLAAARPGRSAREEYLGQQVWRYTISIPYPDVTLDEGEGLAVE